MIILIITILIIRKLIIRKDKRIKERKKERNKENPQINQLGQHGIQHQAQVVGREGQDAGENRRRSTGSGEEKKWGWGVGRWGGSGEVGRWGGDGEVGGRGERVGRGEEIEWDGEG